MAYDQQEQKDILDGGISTNALIPYSAIPAVNKKLKTNEQNSLIKAVNEILGIANTATQGITNGLNDMKLLIGDKSVDPTIPTRLTEVGANIVSGMHNLNEIMKTLIKMSDVDLINKTIDILNVYPSDKLPGFIFILNEGETPPYNKFLCLKGDVSVGEPEWYRIALNVAIAP